jgi:hypothetical protein
MHLAISLSQSRVYTRLPTTRVDAQSKPAKQPEPPIPFADPAALPSLRELRELLKRDSVGEHEIIRVLREAAPRGTRAPASLEAAPERSLKLLLDRWETVRELIEDARTGE